MSEQTPRDDLLERLRRVESGSPRGEFTTNWHRNPDGPEAADRIERLEAEVAAVLAAIPGVRFMDPPDGGDPKPHEEVQRMADALKAAEARAKGGGEWIRKGDALAAIDGAFEEHAAKIRAANAKRGGGLTMHGYDYRARAERARVIARDAISRATGATDAE